MHVTRSPRPRRKRIRLRDYDYSTPGAYFITFRARPDLPPLSQVVGGDLILTAHGAAVRAVWNELPEHYPNVTCDEFIVMPDHVHCIIVLSDARAGFKPAPTGDSGVHGVPEVVRALKGFSARRINQLRKSTGTAVWQRNYYERVIRDERELDAAREYIRGNPARLEQTGRTV